MKRGTRQHPKFKALCAGLGVPEYAGVGLLESLWMTVEEFQDDGAIGRWSDRRIAGAIGWDGDAGQLVMFLVECEWVDRVDGPDRLVVHDWLSHCSSHVWDRVKKRIQRARASGAGKASPSPLVAPWLGAMVDKASAERSRNGPVELSYSGDASGEKGPERAPPQRARPGVSGDVRQRPVAVDSSDPDPRPTTQDPRPAPTAVAVVGAESPVLRVIEPTAAAEGTSLSIPVKEAGPEVVIALGLFESLALEYPELHVSVEIAALASHLRANPASRMPAGQIRACIVKWLNRSRANPHMRQQPAASIHGAKLGIGAARESAMDRKRRELDAALNGVRADPGAARAAFSVTR